MVKQATSQDAGVRVKRVVAIALALFAAALGAAASPASPARGLLTAIIPNPGLDAANDDLQFTRIRAAGASAVNIGVAWYAVVPHEKPLDPTNPADPEYNWSAVDREVLLAAARGLAPIIGISGAPAWAQATVPPGVPHTVMDGPYKPSPTAFGQFARAIATRYSGSFRSEGGVLLPRVRYWIAWNEPNIYRYLTPQTVDGKPFSPEWYRRMVNAFASAVHGVHSNNLVVAGATAPFGIGNRISPLKFMREMLCMSAGKKPHSTCKRKSSFDIWAHHPYTRGDPFHHAQAPDDVSLGDLPEMRTLVDAAVRAHQIVSRRKVGFWVDEFSYNSRPPNTNKLIVPLGLHARYVAESLYQMWRSGVGLATWFLLRDDPVNVSQYQSGLWFNGSQDGDLSQDWPKPSLTAFRFPFVAERNKKKVALWGRTPNSSAASVVIEAASSNGWRPVITLTAGSNGVFIGKIAISRVPNPNGTLRARIGEAASWPFSLVRPRDRFVLPFG